MNDLHEGTAFVSFYIALSAISFRLSCAGVPRNTPDLETPDRCEKLFLEP
jgi:hypothetical protein